MAYGLSAGLSILWPNANSNLAAPDPREFQLAGRSSAAASKRHYFGHQRVLFCVLLYDQAPRPCYCSAILFTDHIFQSNREHVTSYLYTAFV